MRVTIPIVALAELDATPTVSMLSVVHPVEVPSSNVVVFSMVRDDVKLMTLTVVVFLPVE